MWKIAVIAVRTRDLWIRKSVCCPLRHSAPLLHICVGNPYNSFDRSVLNHIILLRVFHRTTCTNWRVIQEWPSDNNKHSVTLELPRPRPRRSTVITDLTQYIYITPEFFLLLRVNPRTSQRRIYRGHFVSCYYRSKLYWLSLVDACTVADSNIQAGKLSDVNDRYIRCCQNCRGNSLCV